MLAGECLCFALGFVLSVWGLSNGLLCQDLWFWSWFAMWSFWKGFWKSRVSPSLARVCLVKWVFLEECGIGKWSGWHCDEVNGQTVLQLGSLQHVIVSWRDEIYGIWSSWQHL